MATPTKTKDIFSLDPVREKKKQTKGTLIYLDLAVLEICRLITAGL